VVGNFDKLRALSEEETKNAQGLEANIDDLLSKKAMTVPNLITMSQRFEGNKKKNINLRLRKEKEDIASLLVGIERLAG